VFKLSPSKYATYTSCKLKYKFQYIDKVEVEKEKSTSTEVGLLVHKVLENYREGLDVEELYEIYKNQYVLTDFDKSPLMKILENGVKCYEPYVGCRFKAEDYLESKLSEEFAIHGYIDKIYFADEDNLFDGKYRACITDHKTGKNKVDNSVQVKFYTALIWHNYQIEPKDVISKINYLRLDDTVTYHFDNEDIEEFLMHLDTFQEIVSMTDRWSHRLTNLCNYCQYKNICEPFKTKQMLLEKTKRRR
jgi:CRISPR/Cas system-associated exonuclease Cas4 (RecB family)